MPDVSWVWAIVEPDEACVQQVPVYVYLTGETIPPEPKTHLGSFKQESLMYHIFTDPIYM